MVKLPRYLVGHTLRPIVDMVLVAGVVSCVSVTSPSGHVALGLIAVVGRSGMLLTTV